MKNILAVLAFMQVVFCVKSQQVQTPNKLNIYQNTGTVLEYALDNVDSMTHSLGTSAYLYIHLQNEPTVTISQNAIDSVSYSFDLALFCETNSTSGVDVITACDTYTWINGVTYTASNYTAKDTLQNSLGCDSIVTLNLTINNSTTGVDVVTACDTFTWINGVTYTASNYTAKDTLQNALGCDSIVTLNLTIGNLIVSTGTITDARDGQVYTKVTYCNGQTWMSQNLNWAGTGYDRPNPIIGYGRLYTWSQLMNGATSSSGNPSGVQGICPSGWHIPSDEEWKNLEKALGMSQTQADDTGWRGTDEGTKMKSTSGWNNSGNGNNFSGFNTFPVGNYNQGSFYDLGNYARFWSSTEVSASHAWNRYLSNNKVTMYRGNFYKSYGFSCRCVED